MRVLTVVIATAMCVIIRAPVRAADPVLTANDDKPVCRYVTHTGTRFETKVCRSAANWGKLSEQSRRNAAEMIDRPAINTARGN